MFCGCSLLLLTLTILILSSLAVLRLIYPHIYKKYISLSTSTQENFEDKPGNSLIHGQDYLNTYRTKFNLQRYLPGYNYENYFELYPLEDRMSLEDRYPDDFTFEFKINYKEFLKTKQLTNAPEPLDIATIYFQPKYSDKYESLLLQAISTDNTNLNKIQLSSSITPNTISYTMKQKTMTSILGTWLHFIITFKKDVKHASDLEDSKSRQLNKYSVNVQMDDGENVLELGTLMGGFTHNLHHIILTNKDEIVNKERSIFYLKSVYLWDSNKYNL
jgi:hypothetical protein